MGEDINNTKELSWNISCESVLIKLSVFQNKNETFWLPWLELAFKTTIYSYNKKCLDALCQTLTVHATQVCLILSKKHQNN
jgi:hypothetical protein